MAAQQRRELDFHTGAEVIAEVERLRSGGYTQTKNWNLTQMCEHLDATTRGGMEGFGFRLPWILRATIIKWMFARMLKKRKMPSGASTMASLKPKTEGAADDDAIINRYLETVREAETYDGSFEDYPFLDNLTPDTWRQFMWLHAAHHLSFLVPKS